LSTRAHLLEILICHRLVIFGFVIMIRPG